MGAAASTLTPAQKEEMAKLVKLEQEANPNATQDEIDAIMAQKYKDNLAEALTANAAGAPLSSGPGAHAKKKNASKPVRRRSFGNETRHVSKSTPGLPTVEGATGDDAIASAISAVAEGTPAADEPPKQDNWDSVSEQPYCAVCCMGFKTLSALDRHVKYSDLHAKQLAKLEGDSAAPLSPAATPFTKDPKSLNSAQTEGTNYRLLYSGGKLFWRTGDDIEFDIYFHVLAHCVEVIAFHSVKNKEWRVYLDYEKILAQVSGALKDAIQKRTQDDRKKQSKFSVAKESTDAAKYDQIVEEECKQQVITNYILNRMQLSAVSAATPTSEVQFVPTAVDVPENSPLRAEPPIGLIPISVNRRRKSSSDEITQSINAIQTDYADLKAATARAEKVSTLVFESANTLTSFLKKSNLSKWAKKWVWAIKLVIRRKHVALMTLRLEELEKEKAARKSNPKAEAVAQRRSHGS